jgi:hypothetical protein
MINDTSTGTVSIAVQVVNSTSVTTLKVGTQIVCKGCSKNEY